MLMKITKSVVEIRDLCIKNNWFTNGTNTQYSLMFDRVRDEADIDEIATIIWVCSENVTKEEIVKELLPVKNNRAEMVRAMELIARAVNDENVFSMWLTYGVADGEIKADTTDNELEWYTEDETFSALMETFLDLMSRAYQSGGLYADGISSSIEEK